MKVLLPIILAILPILSCNTPNERKLVLTQDFPAHVTLQSQKLDFNFSSGCPEELFVANNRLGLIDNHCNDYILQMIDLESGDKKIIFSKGRGPTEFLSLNFTGHRQGDSLLFRTGSSLYWLNPNYLWENQNPQVTEIVNPISDYYINCFQLEKQWAYTSLAGDYSIVFIDENGTSSHNTPFYPPLDFAEPQENIAYRYYSSSSYSDSKNLFVTALRYFPLIIISDMNGEIVNVIQTSKEVNLPEFDSHGMAPQPNTTFYYDRVVLSHDRIFAFRLNAKASDLESFVFNPILEVFDFKGNPILMVNFSEPFSVLDIDFNKGIIYGATFCKESFQPILEKVEIPADLIR